jgi:hypothetical protein
MGARQGRLGTASVFSHTIIYHRGNYIVKTLFRELYT